MGKQVNPIGLRLGICQSWRSTWYSMHGYSSLLHEDIQIRGYIEQSLYCQGLLTGECTIQRHSITKLLLVHVPVYCINKRAKASGKAHVSDKVYSQWDATGQCNYALRVGIAHITNATAKDVVVHVSFAQQLGQLDALLIAKYISYLIEQHTTIKLLRRKYIGWLARYWGVHGGIRVELSGRISGKDRASTLVIHEGSVPLQMIQCHIQYGAYHAYTSNGKLGVKVWLHRKEGEISNS